MRNLAPAKIISPFAFYFALAESKNYFLANLVIYSNFINRELRQKKSSKKIRSNPKQNKNLNPEKII